MRSWTRRPTGLSTRAVTTAVSSPKQRLRPRATLYSPPPSHTWNVRVVWMRPSPGSSRSMTSPRLTRSKRQSALCLTEMGGIGPEANAGADGCQREGRSYGQVSEDEHGVAVAVEAVAERDRFGIRAEHPLAPREGGDEEQERRPGQVEVGDQAVEDRESVPGHDDEVGRAGARPDLATGQRAGLERASGGGADGDDAAAARAGLANGGGRGFGERERLGIDPVVGDVVDRDRLEGARPDVQDEL